MNLNAVLQLALTGPGLLSIVTLTAIAAAFQSRHWASALSLVALALSGMVAAGFTIMVLLLCVSGGGGAGIISPLAFAGTFAEGFIAYVLLFTFAVLLRPRPFRCDRTTSIMLVLGLGFLFGVILRTVPSP